MGNFIAGILNALIKGLGSVLSFIALILPPSPFRLLDIDVIKPYISGLNWLLPIRESLLIGEVWLSAVGVYYLYQIVLRWLKAIE